MTKLHRFTLLFSFSLFSMLSFASEVRPISFESPVLGREYLYNIYLPDGYEDGELNYSVLYLLHGNLGTENSWIQAGKIADTADELISAGKIPAQLIVVPADPRFWWADGKDEKAMTALVEDLLGHIDETWRTIDSREGRAIAGYSAGGFGTANIALKYPELFAAAAPLSPAVYTPVPPSDSSATRQDTFMSNGEFDPELWNALNWVSFIENYKEKGIVVPFYINTGDHDRFDIAYHAAVFYQALREHQPEFTELRIFDGDHDFAAWGATIGLAMEYMSNFIAKPH